MKKHVFDNMTRKIVTVQWNEDLEKAYSKMKNANIRHLVAIDNTGYPMGIISERDFQRAKHFGKFDQNQTVEDYMSWPIETVHAGIDLKTAAHLMIEKKISALLVADEEKLMGVITTQDLLKALIEIIETDEFFKNKVEGFIYNSPIGAIINELNTIGI